MIQYKIHRNTLSYVTKTHNQIKLIEYFLVFMDLMHTFATEKTYNNNLKTTNMKKISTILLFVSCSFGFACCQSERCFQETLASIPNNEIKTTNNLLKFSSKEAMYDTISMLLKHTTEEQIA